MNEILNNSIFQNILAGLLTAGLVAIFSYIRVKYLRNKYDYLLGEWNSYHFSKNESYIHEIKVIIKPKLNGQISISMEEKSAANYLEEGKIKIIENSVFGILNGKTHPSKGFLVLKLPFNRKDKIPAMNGIYTGVDQNNIPMSIKIHLSRFPLNKTELKKELGREKKYIVSDIEATRNVKQNTIIDSSKLSAKK